MMDGFWKSQEEFESEMGWNTEERVQEAEDTGEARLEELNFSLYRAFEETVELCYEATGISLDSSRDQEISDEQYDRLGYEIVDTLIFLKKAGDTLNQDLEEHLGEERNERYGESGENLDELLEPGLDPEIHDEDSRAEKLRSYAIDVLEQVGPKELDVDNLYNEFRDIYVSGDYSSDGELGAKLAAAMLDTVEMIEHLPGKPEKYFREKQEENRQRLESGEEFGEGSRGYGETPDWILKEKEEGTEPAYINILS